ncbi:Hypothetical protein AA314_10000 [Archangium gephyra]|uniref:Uncharacterized protein n=1 Tax=Archangium gephyra TaxID=48 RepID=A0AAC8QJ02_9BACT|nr:Hypothetical protein AA314_10000 [Archangium gephyra]
MAVSALMAVGCGAPEQEATGPADVGSLEAKVQVPCDTWVPSSGYLTSSSGVTAYDFEKQTACAGSSIMFVYVEAVLSACFGGDCPYIEIVGKNGGQVYDVSGNPLPTPYRFTSTNPGKYLAIEDTSVRVRVYRPSWTTVTSAQARIQLLSW